LGTKLIMYESEYFYSKEANCPYLSDKKEIVQYKYIHNPNMEYYAKFVKRGWRRFGYLLHIPRCNGCNDCKNLRVNISQFKFSKSVRSVLKKSKHLRAVFQKPSSNIEHINLYNKYHSFMSKKKGWNYNEINELLYIRSFVDSSSTYGYEIVYYDDDKIIGVDFIDIIDDGISSIYFFYDPEYSSYSLGKLSIYHEILIAKKLGLKWLYMGYFVEECPSLNYKKNYKPYQLLQGRPELTDDIVWHNE